MRRLLLTVTVGLLALTFIAGCASSPQGGPSPAATQPPTATQPAPSADATTAPAGTAAISIINFSFNPATLTVKKGTTVTWTNNDSIGHDVASDTSGATPAGPTFKSPVLRQGETFSFTFDTVGEHPYICAIHPQMKGKIIIQE